MEALGPRKNMSVYPTELLLTWELEQKVSAKWLRQAWTRAVDV